MTSTADPRLALPPRPEPPDPSECCGNGCNPCVHDLYGEQLAEWERRVAALASPSPGAVADRAAT
jgi:hypothetical protein